MVEERLSGPRDERCLISQDVRERQRLGGSKEMRGKEQQWSPWKESGAGSSEDLDSSSPGSFILRVLVHYHLYELMIW